MRTHQLQARLIITQERRVLATKLDSTIQPQVNGTLCLTLKVCSVVFRLQRPSKTSTFGSTMVRRSSCSTMKTSTDSALLLEKNSTSMSTLSHVQRNSLSLHTVEKVHCTLLPMAKSTTMISLDSTISMSSNSSKKTSSEKNSRHTERGLTMNCTSFRQQQEDSISL